MARGALGSTMLRAEQNPEFQAMVNKTPEFAQAQAQARRTGQTVTSSFQGKTFRVHPDGLFETPDGFWKSILPGLIAAGTVLAGSQLIPLLSGGGAAGTGITGTATGATAPTGLAADGTLAGVATTSTAGTLPAGAATSGALGGGSIGSKILGLGKSILGGGSNLDKAGRVIGAIGKGLGSLGKGQTDERERRDAIRNNFGQNRDTIAERAQNNFDQLRLSAQNDFDRLRLEAAANRRADESDAWKKLQFSEYLGNNAHGYKPPKTGSGVQLTDYGIGPFEPTANERAGASTLSQQMLQRLQPGGSFSPTPMFTPTPMFQPTQQPNITDPSTTEKFLGVGSTIAEILAALRNRDADRTTDV